MSITEKEPVVEQPSDDIKIEDSEESASESPTTSSSYVEKIIKIMTKLILII